MRAPGAAIALIALALYGTHAAEGKHGGGIADASGEHNEKTGH
jgi:hypothetical protein